MAYTPKTAFAFTGNPHSPPVQGETVGFGLQAGISVEYPVPPGLIVAMGTGWSTGRSRNRQAASIWQPSSTVDAGSRSGFGEADERNALPMSQPWDTVPRRDQTDSIRWGTPTVEQAKAESRWANTRPIDPAPVPLPWDETAQPKEAHTGALWGQPPTKDAAYGGPWFVVDVYRKTVVEKTDAPTLYLSQLQSPLAFQFDGQTYNPDQSPVLWFGLGLETASSRPVNTPVTPTDVSPRSTWGQSRKLDRRPDFPWGEGRFDRIKDNKHTVDYGGKVVPLPLEPPTPDDKESYLLMNTVNAVRLPDEEPLELMDISIDLDIDSFTWQLSATVANRAVLALIEPNASGTKDIKITINGWDWVFMATRYDAERRFGEERFRISGESRTRLLSAPYAPLRSKTESSAISAVQAAEAELTNTGFTLSWDSTETWATPDWILPGGLFSYVNQTPMEVIASIANTAGAVVIPAADSDQLAVQPRYRISPWNWLEDTTPIDHAIPESMMLSMSVEWRPEPEYNAVYVSGINEGVAVAVQREGSAGNRPAPDIIEDWLTAVDVNTERGRNVLSEGGNQAVVTLDLPLTVNGQEPGLVLPGRLVEVIEGTEPWIGLCLSTGIRTAGSGAGKVVQSLSLERHYQEG